MTMYVMERDLGAIIAARLAEMMEVAPATVTMTLKRMERDRWIAGKARKEIHLTEEGLEASRSVIRRHMLVEWLLVKILKIPLEQVHDEAHHIEHAISPRLEQQMREILLDPKLCPHGNPFPGHEALTRAWTPLTGTAVGERFTIRRIHEFAEDRRELIDFFVQHEIRPGTAARLLERLPFNQTLTLEIAGKRVILGYQAAQYVHVETDGGHREVAVIAGGA